MKITKIKKTLLFVAMTIVVCATNIFSAPVDGEIFNIRQPNGATVSVRVWGDEFHLDVESLDGFTLVNGEDGWLYYAVVSDDGREYLSSGVRYISNDVANKISNDFNDINDNNVNTPPPALQRNLRIDRNVVAEKRRAGRVEMGHDELARTAPVSRRNRIAQQESSLSKITNANAIANVNDNENFVQEIVGLTILIDFPDQQGTFSQQTIFDHLNREGGINGNSPAGSVRDYFLDISSGQLDFSNIVTDYITMPNPRAYYDSGNRRERMDEIIEYAIAQLIEDGFDFGALTTRNDNANNVDRITSLSVYYAGSRVPNTSSGGPLWPHASHGGSSFTYGGISFHGYQVTDITDELTLGTFTHELGHLLMGWRDVYDHGNEDMRGRTVGNWCLMGNSNLRFPPQPNAYFRYLAGWIEAIDINDAQLGDVLTITSNSDTAFVYWKDDREAFFIEARLRSGDRGVRNQSLPGSGLAIWHVHAEGRNTIDTVPLPMLALIQADGGYDLELRTNRGDETDLYRAGLNTLFNNTSTPPALWHDNTPSGILISNISDTGAVMTFEIAVSDENVVNPKYKFLRDVANYGLTNGNAEVIIDNGFTLDMLVRIPAPKTAGATLTIRSADAENPATIRRGVAGDLFTIPTTNNATLILRDIIIDGAAMVADSNGALVRVNRANTFIMEDGVVLRNNIADSRITAGGGVSISGGTFVMNGGKIYGNTAGRGNGVRVMNVTVDGETIRGMAHLNGGVIAGLVGNDTALSATSINHVVGGTLGTNFFLNEGEESAPNNSVVIVYNAENDNLIVRPTTATASVETIDDVRGITYANGDNVGFIPIERLTPSTSILEIARDVVGVGEVDEVAVVAPVGRASVGLVIGPNPVERLGGRVMFYLTGAEIISSGVFTIFDANGNVVRRLSVDSMDSIDNVGNVSNVNNVHRKIATWDLRDNNGRIVNEGTYLVRGILTINGNRERVSTLIGIY